MQSDLPTSGFTKLYHPRGCCVTIPVPTDPVEAFTHIDRCINAGWLVIAPGLEEGEVKEEVGYVLRGSIEHDGEITPTLLLYSTNEGHSFSFLKVYLNNLADIQAFEHAAGMRLNDFPEYAGNDKPERGKSSKLDQFIVRVRKPFGVVLKSNPKYHENDRAAAVGRGEIYKVARRLFVRWADQAPKQAEQSTDGDAHEGPSTKPPPSDPNRKSAPATDATQTTNAENYGKAIKAFSTVTTLESLNQWAEWVKKIGFDQGQKAKLLESYQRGKERLSKPVQPMNPPPGTGKDIPF